MIFTKLWQKKLDQHFLLRIGCLKLKAETQKLKPLLKKLSGLKNSY